MWNKIKTAIVFLEVRQSQALEQKPNQSSRRCRDISVREVAWSRILSVFAVLDCHKRGSRTENRDVECARRKKKLESFNKFSKFRFPFPIRMFRNLFWNVCFSIFGRFVPNCRGASFLGFGTVISKSGDCHVGKPSSWILAHSRSEHCQSFEAMIVTLRIGCSMSLAGTVRLRCDCGGELCRRSVSLNSAFANVIFQLGNSAEQFCSLNAI